MMFLCTQSLPTPTTSQQQAAATTIMNVGQMASATNGNGLASQSTVRI